MLIVCILTVLLIVFNHFCMRPSVLYAMCYVSNRCSHYIDRIQYNIELASLLYCIFYAYAKKSHKLRNVSAQKIQTKCTGVTLCHCMPRSKFHNLGDHQSENYTR